MLGEEFMGDEALYNHYNDIYKKNTNLVCSYKNKLECKAATHPWFSVGRSLGLAQKAAQPSALTGLHSFVVNSHYLNAFVYIKIFNKALSTTTLKKLFQLKSHFFLLFL